MLHSPSTSFGDLKQSLGKNNFTDIIHICYTFFGAVSRNAERALARGSESGPTEGGEWTRVAELCDFGPRRGRDVARLRSIVLQLKQAGVRPKYPPRATQV